MKNIEDCKCYTTLSYDEAKIEQERNNNKMEELKVGNRYLIKNEKGKYEEIKVEEETKDQKFIKIGYESGSKIWYSREEINIRFHIIAQIN